jgi:hypothetical protein
MGRNSFADPSFKLRTEDPSLARGDRTAGRSFGPFVGNRMDRPKRDALLESSAFSDRDQVSHLTFQVHPDYKKYIVTAFDPDSLTNFRYSHNSQHTRSICSSRQRAASSKLQHNLFNAIAK